MVKAKHEEQYSCSLYYLFTATTVFSYLFCHFQKYTGLQVKV